MSLVSRRTFVKGLAAGGAAAGLGGFDLRAWAQELRQPQVLRGTSFDLSIAEAPMNFTGSTKIAQTINGSIPGPLLRWREGDTVTLRVANQLDEDTSIHWHGIVLPADMDGVPGLSFHGIRPRESYTYRFQVRQSGTYWYHSHSGFQEQRGVYGPIVIDPREPDPVGVRSRARHPAVGLDRRGSGARLPEAEEAIRLLQLPQAHARRLLHGRARARGSARRVADRSAWGAMRMNPTDLADVGGSTYTHLMNGVTPRGNWTGLFGSGERVRLRIINGSSMTVLRRPHSGPEDDRRRRGRPARASGDRR